MLLLLMYSPNALISFEKEIKLRTGLDRDRASKVAAND